MAGIWDLYNLRGNPFFQDPLGSDLAANLPALQSLFVGRTGELALAERMVTHDTRTRVVLTGEAGVGKTTFLNRLQKRLEDLSTPGRRFITHTPALRIQGEWTAIDLCAEVLRTILLMRETNRSRAHSANIGANLSSVSTVFSQMTTIPDFWDRVTQIVEGRQFLGIGVQGGNAFLQGGATIQPAWAPPTLPPATLLLLTMDAIRIASEELNAELVFVLNNLENLSRDDAKRAAGLFQDIRDLFLTDHSHWIVCGTTEIDTLVIRASTQVGGIFGTPLTLLPLTKLEVADLLQRRYQALARGVQPVIPPIDPEVGAYLYTLYQGNLRHFLQLLQDAVLRGAGPGGARSLPMETVIGIMGHEHIRTMQDRLGGTSWNYFHQTVLGTNPDDPILARFRQADAARRTGKKAPVIKPHMDAWIEAGYLVSDPQDTTTAGQRRGDWMRLSGVAAVGFAALAQERGKSIQDFFAIVSEEPV